MGAGLRPGELAALHGSDIIVRHGRQVMVQVSGPTARVVPVTSRYAFRAGELARRAGSGHVFRPGPADRAYKNFVTNFARGLAADPAAPALSMRRAGLPSSAVTWPRAPRSRCCWPSPGSPRPDRWPATPATSPDDGTMLTADSGDALLGLIREDYAARPVPRDRP